MTATTAHDAGAIQPVALEPASSLVTVTHVTYALHALGLAIGAFGASVVPENARILTPPP